MAGGVQDRRVFKGPLGQPRFRTIWLAETLVVFADQIFLVALTVLVIDIEGAGAEVGIVLAAASAPMALVLPLGGWIGDHFPPERILFATNCAQAALTAGLAVLVLSGEPPLWPVLLLVAAMGAVDGVHFPAAFSFTPRLVPPEQLQAANSLVQGSETVSDLAGPALAAVAAGALGLGSVFVAVAALSVLAALLLGRATARLPEARLARAAERGGPFAELGAGLRYARQEPRIRALLLLLAALSLTGIGPYFVGAAALAETRLGGAENLGAIFAAFGGGALLGLGIAAAVGHPKHRGAVLVVSSAAIGLGMAGLGLAETQLAAVAVSAAIGVAEAFLDVVLISWLHEEIPESILSRTMTLVVLAEVLMDPLSFAAAGLLLPLGVGTLFAIAGGLMVAAAAAAALSPTIRAMS